MNIWFNFPLKQIYKNVCVCCQLSFLKKKKENRNWLKSEPAGQTWIGKENCNRCISIFLHLVDDSLGFESCAFCSMICSVVSLLLPGFSLFLLLLLHPGSQPTLTYVSASDVLIYNRTMLITMLNFSPTLLVTPVIHLNAPILCTNLLHSPPHLIPPHGRTSWGRSTVHWERLWAHLPVAWRKLWGECSLYSIQTMILHNNVARIRGTQS